MAYHPENVRYCQRCHKARKACVCAWLSAVRGPRLHFHVHPRELVRVRSTGWLAHCMAEGSGYASEGTPEPDLEGWVLLFPGEGSVPWSAAGRFRGVVVPDGTWEECRAMILRSPQLARLPRIGLQGDYQGRFQVRRPPWSGALCTVEAVGLLLLEMGFPDGQRCLDLLHFLNERELALSGGRLRR